MEFTVCMDGPSTQNFMNHGFSFISRNCRCWSCCPCPLKMCCPRVKFIAAHSIQEFANVWIPLKTCFHIATLDHKRVKSIQLQVHVQWPQWLVFCVEKEARPRIIPEHWSPRITKDFLEISQRSTRQLEATHTFATERRHDCYRDAAIAGSVWWQRRSEHCRHDLRLKPWDCWAVGAVFNFTGIKVCQIRQQYLVFESRPTSHIILGKL